MVLSYLWFCFLLLSLGQTCLTGCTPPAHLPELCPVVSNRETLNPDSKAGCENNADEVVQLKCQEVI